MHPGPLSTPVLVSGSASGGPTCRQEPYFTDTKCLNIRLVLGFPGDLGQSRALERTQKVLESGEREGLACQAGRIASAKV